jgi:hypothetical protein
LVTLSIRRYRAGPYVFLEPKFAFVLDDGEEVDEAGGVTYLGCALGL